MLIVVKNLYNSAFDILELNYEKNQIIKKFLDFSIINKKMRLEYIN